MTDIRYLQQADGLPYSFTLDFFLNDLNQIEEGYSLQSAVIVALGTDARAGEADILPDPDATDRRGWWGDMDAEEIWNGWPVGCKLWLLERSKITTRAALEGDTLERAESYTMEALRPFVTAQIASQVDAQASRTDTYRVDVAAIVTRGRKDSIVLRYAQLWEELGRL